MRWDSRGSLIAAGLAGPRPRAARVLRAGVPALVLVVAAACGSNSSTPTEPKMTPAPGSGASPTVTVGGSGNTFVDSQSGTSTTTIQAGQTVTWMWAGGSHSTTSGNCCTASGMWDSGVRSSGSFSYAFMTAGTYPYFCTVHGAMMTGTVKVNAAGGGGY
ncbi:MAG TPA: plastocyanin/azurin family copper-binding protein [Thermoanaerobaculaceae bacterium]|nr:plastocyanin/azurin family copper-binding protein [Thermoanaerobaculaceae bacterium]